jgi:hypothetical protein
MKIRPDGAEICHANGQTDMTTPTAAIRNCGNAPKNSTDLTGNYPRPVELT